MTEADRSWILRATLADLRDELAFTRSIQGVDKEYSSALAREIIKRTQKDSL